MPKRNRTKRGGGVWDSIKSGMSGLSNSVSSLWKPKQYPNQVTYGGKRTRKNRHVKKGGFKDNTPQTGLAAHAGSFSGATARPQAWVGGKRTKRRRRH